tara:strand:+ start:47 stop:469 length:423 start_codon:yes stop_codon:yes gene_type:complete
MIKYNLKCKNNHEFESWFSDSKEFDKLNKKKLLECIYCASRQIEKNIMSPVIFNSKKRNKTNDTLNHQITKGKKELLALRNYVEKNFEFVGDKFSKKVREIYYDKETKKSIYGTTTEKERQELADEGIDLLSIPWVSKDN